MPSLVERRCALESCGRRDHTARFERRKMEDGRWKRRDADLDVVVFAVVVVLAVSSVELRFEIKE